VALLVWSGAFVRRPTCEATTSSALQVKRPHARMVPAVATRSRRFPAGASRAETLLVSGGLMPRSIGTPILCAWRGRDDRIIGTAGGRAAVGHRCYEHWDCCPRRISGAAAATMIPTRRATRRRAVCRVHRLHPARDETAPARLSPGTAAGPRWRALAAAKRRDIDGLIARAVMMKALLQRITTNYRCDTLLECGRALARNRARWTAVNPRPAPRDCSTAPARATRPKPRHGALP
jgi:hypothetical protein